MQKQAPSIGRILIAVGFTLSCFGLILFLWIAFGGPIPLKPAELPDLGLLPGGDDPRRRSPTCAIGGVSVGKVKELNLAPVSRPRRRQRHDRGGDRDRARSSPRSPATRKAILRQKTLLGETYIELTPGTETGRRGRPGRARRRRPASPTPRPRTADPVEEGGTLGHRPDPGLDPDRRDLQRARRGDADLVPELARQQRRRRSRGAASTSTTRSATSGPFVSDANDILEILNRQKASLKGLVRDTGTVFEALTARDQELAGVITGSHDTFEALAREDDALAESFQILPTFERESRLTFDRLDEFQANTRPLIQDLIPVAQDLSPTLRSVRALSPNLRSLFSNLDTLFEVGKDGLPALERTLNGLGAGARRARPVPRQPRPGAALPRLPEDDDHRLPRRARARRCRTRSTRSRRPAGGAPLPAPARLPRARRPWAPIPIAAQHQPRQRLPRPGRAHRLPVGARAGSSPTSTAATSTTRRRRPQGSARGAPTRRSTPPPTRRRASPTSARASPRACSRTADGNGDFPGGFGSGRFPTLFADP